jgi:hypothetical protein
MTSHHTTNEEHPWTGPWGPGVTAFEAMKNVVSLHIARALVESASDDVREWARELAAELKGERIDLVDDIARHVLRRTLAGLHSDIPF